MANIEIISVRFNLDRDDDRRLFEELQKRSDPGKRNDFIKQALLEFLTGDNVGGMPVTRPSKKQSKKGEPAEADAGEQALEITGTSHAGRSGTLSPPKPVPAKPSFQQASDKDASASEPDPEAAGLVGSFVQ